MLFMGFGPISCSAELVVGQIVDSISTLYHHWGKVMLTIVKKEQACRSSSHQENNGKNCKVNFENTDR